MNHLSPFLGELENVIRNNGDFDLFLQTHAEDPFLVQHAARMPEIIKRVKEKIEREKLNVFQNDYRRAVQEGKKEEFLNKHDGEPLLVALQAEMAELNKTEWKFNFDGLRNATPEEENDIQAIKKQLEECSSQDSELYKTVGMIELLMKNNVTICHELVKKGAGNYSPRFPTIILHPEQGDASLEVRVWNFLACLKSIFNHIKEVENSQERTDLIKRFADECKGGLCMEARSSSSDTWYKENQNLIEMKGFDSFLNSQEPLKQRAYQSILWLINMMTAQAKIKNEDYKLYTKRIDELESILKNNPKNMKLTFQVVRPNNQSEAYGTSFDLEELSDLLTQKKQTRDKKLEAIRTACYPDIISAAVRLVNRQASDTPVTADIIRGVFDDCGLEDAIPPFDKALKEKEEAELLFHTAQDNNRHPSHDMIMDDDYEGGKNNNKSLEELLLDDDFSFNDDWRREEPNSDDSTGLLD